MALQDIIFIFAVIAIVTAVTEYLTKRFLYDSPEAKEMIDRIARVTKTLKVAEAKVEGSSGNAAVRAQKEVDYIKKELFDLQGAKMRGGMGWTVLGALSGLLLFYGFRTMYADVAIATLPFVPTFGYFKMIFQQGLKPESGHPPNAASYLVFTIMANTLLKPLIAKALGSDEAAKAYNAGGGATPGLMELSQSMAEKVVGVEEPKKRR